MGMSVVGLLCSELAGVCVTVYKFSPAPDKFWRLYLGWGHELSRGGGMGDAISLSGPAVALGLAVLGLFVQTSQRADQKDPGERLPEGPVAGICFRHAVLVTRAQIQPLPRQQSSAHAGRGGGRGRCSARTHREMDGEAVKR